MIVVGSGVGEKTSFEIECARHSPLRIVKDQLLRSHLPNTFAEKERRQDMSLVLQSETDEEDGTLLEGDDERVQYLGIKEGSTVWVSFLNSKTLLTPKVRRSKTQESPPVSPLTPADGSRDGTTAGNISSDAEAAVTADAVDELVARRAREEVRAWLGREEAQRTAARQVAEQCARRERDATGLKLDAAAPGPIHEHTMKLSVTLDTPVQPRQADHSYNGVVFDIEASSCHEITVTSIWLGGMLGKVRAFTMATAEPWHKGDFQRKIRRCGWNNINDVLSAEDWKEVGCQRLAAAWNGTRELVLDAPVRIMPGETRGFYVHSGLPDDLGIQYQSYHGQEELVARDQFLTVIPGIGHTGSVPFENHHGWYRAIRGPCGAFQYTATLRTWTAQVTYLLWRNRT